MREHDDAARPRDAGPLGKERGEVVNVGEDTDAADAAEAVVLEEEWFGGKGVEINHLEPRGTARYLERSAPA